jgi:putative redox protein
MPKKTKLQFKNDAGTELAAWLEKPVSSKPKAYVLFAHCFTCSKNLKAIGNISRAMTQKGFAVLRFDFTGLGDSEGEFSDANFSSNIDDLISAARYLESQFQAPSVLIGHSLGGAAVLHVASKLPAVKAVATIGAPSNPEHVKHLIESSEAEIEKNGAAKVNIGGRPFTIKKQFLEDLEEHNMKNVLSNLNVSTLILHSPQDKIVGINNATEIYKALKHPRSFISLDGADHLLSNQEDSFYAGNVIASWAMRYLETEEKQKPQTDKQALARLAGEEFTTEIVTGNHSLLADEPREAGGNDLGPSPYDLVSSGLAACTAMTIRMYANRKKWKLSEVRVHVEHKREHSDDCDTCETSNSRIDKFYRDIELEGDLDDSQKNRMLEIANKCPVHRTLQSDILIETRLLT